MKKGFTLVELLAVIVILAVILVIAVPQINSVIKQTKINGLASTGKLIAAKAEEKEVENQALESNEALTCANLVKLDDNYGNCTVSIVNGKGTVTIAGAGKFAGITCTGTKDNMTCTENSNTPEYVYSYGMPQYKFQYTVTNPTACIDYAIQDTGMDSNDPDYEDALADITSICNGNGSDGQTTSEIIEELYNIDGGYTITNKNACISFMLEDGNAPQDAPQDAIEAVCNGNGYDGMTTDEILHYYPYEAISSFARISNDQMDSFVSISLSTVLTGVEEDYHNLNSNEFIRWPGNTVNFDNNVEKELCVIYNDKFECFEPKASAYSENAEKLRTVFNNAICSENEYEGAEYTTCHFTATCVGDVYVYKNGELKFHNCSISSNGLVTCDKGFC